MSRTPSRRILIDRRPGFTLVEMIVTIGIIGLLLGLTFPALRTFQREAQNVQCLSNLKQLGGILQTYMNQSGGLPPMVDFIPAATNNGPVGGLPQALRGFIDKDDKCWCCPSDTDAQGSLSTGTSYFYMPGLLRYSPNVQIQVQQALIPYYLDPTATDEQIERRQTEMECRIVTAFYRQDGRRMPMLLDSVDRHPGTRIPRNALFFDGSVGMSTDTAEILEGAEDAQDDFEEDPDMTDSLDSLGLLEPNTMSTSS